MYFVIDFYEGLDVIGQFTTLSAAKQACNQRIEETDGECNVDFFITENEDDRYYLKKWGLI